MLPAAGVLLEGREGRMSGREEERRISRSAVFFSFLFLFFFVLSQRLPSHPGHRGLVGLFSLCLDADDAELPCPATASRPAMSPLL